MATTTAWKLMVFALPVSSAAALPPAPAGVQLSHEQGIEFVTVGNPNNPAYQGGPLVFGQP